MEPLTRTQQPKPNPAAAIAQNLFKGVGIGLGIYVLWVIAHAILFGMGG